MHEVRSSILLRLIALVVVLACGCHGSADPSTPAAVAFDAPTHFKNGGRGIAGGVTFTVRILPKLLVSGPQPEIEQLQIECVRGADQGIIQIDTLHKRAEWGGLSFELGYADIYHDDVELQIHRK